MHGVFIFKLLTPATSASPTIFAPSVLMVGLPQANAPKIRARQNTLACALAPIICQTAFAILLGGVGYGRT